MAPLPQSNTERWWLIYANNNTEHRMGIRTADGQNNVGISAVFQGFMTQINSIALSTTVLGLERALKGSNVRIPFPYTGTVPGGTGTQVDTDRRARFLTFTGRSQDGRKQKVFWFGVQDITEGDYRVDTSESVAIANVVTHLSGAVNVYWSISGLPVTWHAYANIGYHDHWIKQYRKGG